MAQPKQLKTAEGQVLVIAGNDPLGKAGLVRDISTITALGGQACLAVSALTVQNDQKLSALLFPEGDFFRAQIETALESQTVKIIKIGMIGHSKNLLILSRILKAYPEIPVILDPVFYASSGGGLHQEQEEKFTAFLASFRKELLPYATIITPNLAELAILSQKPQAPNPEAALSSAYYLQQTYNVQNILIKGGHSENLALCGYVEDIFLKKDQTISRFCKPFIAKSMRGTGCLLASAIATLMAKGAPLEEAIEGAKHHLQTEFEHLPS